MQQWTDLFLNKPMPEVWMQGLLFVTFGLHLLFVLLMLGTALLSLLFFTSLADRLTGFLSKKFPVASEWVIAVFNGSLLILTTALLV